MRREVAISAEHRALLDRVARLESVPRCKLVGFLIDRWTHEAGTTDEELRAWCRRQGLGLSGAIPRDSDGGAEDAD